MNERSQEGDRRNERFSRALSLPFAIAIGATAVLGSQAQAVPENTYELPQLQAESPNSPLKIETYAVIDHSIASGYRYESNDLPPLFTAAFDNALHNPVVQLSIHENAISAADVTTVSRNNSKYIGDTGEWVNTDNHVSLKVSTDKQPPSEHIYSDARVVSAELEHETLHALNEKWFQYIRQSAMPRPNSYDSLIMTGSAELTKSLNIALDELRDACRAGRADSQNLDCQNLDSKKFSWFLRDTYRCIDEGYALQRPLGRHQPLAMGHPYDNLTETGSSLLLSLDSNPTYVKDCLSDTTNEVNGILRKLSNTVLRLAFTATPALETYFRQDSEKAATIDWLLETS